MKTIKTFLVEKEWDNEQAGFIYAGTQNTNKIKELQEAIKQDAWVIHNLKENIEVRPNRLKKIAFGYLTLEQAKKAVETLNKECAQCPRRAALHTTYRVVEPAIYIRQLSADDTYQEKLKEQKEQNAS